MSPAQLFFYRRLGDNIPSLSDLLKPNLVNNSQLRRIFNKRQIKQKYFYDKNIKCLREGKENDIVSYRLNNIWKKGRILKKCKEPRSYLIQDNNHIRRRTREHIILNDNSNTLNVNSSENFENVNKDKENFNVNRYNLRNITLIKKPCWLGVVPQVN